ncbi:putative histone deacetylase complex subunit cti6 [Chaetomidium leptoderma]|uniref:Histone deacetylase complex subunit cti6 n=1 Tax=Chaetomidium leptoderma TaxID=669021 RepID=A0AAN6ZUG4_9PEZI|nr:putative histone deacetylase complex subunit cti6 [Chaetomidium leptoderma]
MAATDPRRSSRARMPQSQSQISSSASSISGRPERSSRYFNKAVSPQKSTSTGSLSSEPPEDTITAEDPFGTRRRTRGQAEETQRAGGKAEAIDMANGDGDLQEEDEAVRCVCGNDEYQGPPPFDEDSKHGFKHAFGLDPFFSADVTDDTAGLFVQCDICKVWQHGGCVGIMTEESSPDEYFCEQCRQDLHKLWTASNGSVYSHYLPLKRPGTTTSRAESLTKDTARSPTKEKETRNGRGSSASQSSKRRSTLNSREAGYDEAEALRRAIEASKEDASPEAESVNRRPKRGRSDSQEKPENTKRQKTSSRSASPLSDKNAEDSDEAGATGRNGASKSKPKSRSAVATRNQRTEKVSEKEERERQRAETANKRKGRADRRRADGMGPSIGVKVSGAHADTESDPSEELPLAVRATASKMTQASGVSNAAVIATVTEIVLQPAAAATEPPTTANPAPDTPPTITVQAKVDKKRSHKKKGRNQYTRDRDGRDDESPARSQSRDIQKDDHGPLGGAKMGGEVSGKATSKSRGTMSSKITMNDMKRRATALLDFISRTQLELAGESLPGTTAGSASSTDGNSAAASDKQQNGATDTPTLVLGKVGDAVPGKEFKELGCMEMMDSLTGRLVKWQQQYTI